MLCVCCSDTVLGSPGDVASLEPPVWYLVLCLLFVWALVFACLLYGITSIGKVSHWQTYLIWGCTTSRFLHKFVMPK